MDKPIRFFAQLFWPGRIAPVNLHRTSELGDVLRVASGWMVEPSARPCRLTVMDVTAGRAILRAETVGGFWQLADPVQ